jgi:hypothetical protein
MNNGVNCRFCASSLAAFVGLGTSPLCESLLGKDQFAPMEPFYALAVYVSWDWLLVQVQQYVAPEYLFSEYTRADLAWEAEGRDHAPARLNPRSGRQVRRPKMSVI